MVQYLLWIMDIDTWFLRGNTIDSWSLIISELWCVLSFPGPLCGISAGDVLLNPVDESHACPA